MPQSTHRAPGDGRERQFTHSTFRQRHQHRMRVRRGPNRRHCVSFGSAEDRRGVDWLVLWERTNERTEANTR